MMKRLLAFLVLLAGPVVAQQHLNLTNAPEPSDDSCDLAVFSTADNDIAFTVDNTNICYDTTLNDFELRDGLPTLDNVWIGVNAGGRIVFNDEATDKLTVTDANFGVGVDAVQLFEVESASTIAIIRDTDSGPSFRLVSGEALPAADTVVGQIQFRGDDSAATETNYARIQGLVTDDTDTSEDGYLTISTVVAGTLAERLRIANPTITDGQFCQAGANNTFDCDVAQNAGTDITADMEEETHGLEHNEAGTDEVTVEALGTACTDGQTFDANATTGVDCVTVGGDVTGPLDALVVGDNSHSHTESNISDLDHLTEAEARTGLVENGSAEMTVETLGTACTDGQLVEANATGGVDCVTAGGDVSGPADAFVVADNSHSHTESNISDLDHLTEAEARTGLIENGSAEMTGETLGTACAENQILKANATGGLDCAADATGGSPTFDQIGTGTNTTATMTVGTGGSMTTSGSGTIAATTAAALAANGGNCASGEIPLGVDAAGAVEGCYEPTEADISDLNHTDTSKLPLAGGTMTGEMVVDDLGLEFTPGDVLTDCSTFAATGGGIFYDDSEGIFKKCQDNTLTDLDTGGAETNDLESVATNAGDAEVFVGTGPDAGAYITGLAACAADEKIEYVPGAPDTFTCEAIGSLVEADIGNLDHLTEAEARTGLVENGSAEMTVETLGTACTDGQAVEANATGGVDCVTVGGDVTGALDALALAADVVAPAEMADADHGDVAWSSGVATVQAVDSATSNTESADNNTTQVATTAFVQQEINGAGGTNLTCSAGQCNVDDAFLSNSGDVGTGDYDFGGAEVEIGNGANPALDTLGEVAIDTTDFQLIGYDGSAERVLAQDVKTVCGLVENLAAADDDMPFPISSTAGITLVSAFCHCQGTCTTEADLSFEYVEVGTGGPTVTDVTGSVTCEDYVTGDSATTLSGSTSVPYLDVLRFDVDNAVSPETDEYSICVNYRITGS